MRKVRDRSPSTPGRPSGDRHGDESRIRIRRESVFQECDLQGPHVHVQPRVYLINVPIFYAGLLSLAAPFLDLPDIGRLAVTSKHCHEYFSGSRFIASAVQARTDSRATEHVVSCLAWGDAFTAVFNQATLVRARMVRSARDATLRTNPEVCSFLRAMHEWNHAGSILLRGDADRTARGALDWEKQIDEQIDVATLIACAASFKAAHSWNIQIAEKLRFLGQITGSREIDQPGEAGGTRYHVAPPVETSTNRPKADDRHPQRLLLLPQHRARPQILQRARSKSLIPRQFTWHEADGGGLPASAAPV